MAISGGKRYEDSTSAGSHHFVVGDPCVGGWGPASTTVMTVNADPGPASTTVMTVNDDPAYFPDSVIIACVHEAARRADQIEREAAERVAGLRKALANPNPMVNDP